jgi:hypothetical protein
MVSVSRPVESVFGGLGFDLGHVGLGLGLGLDLSRLGLAITI